MLVLSAAQNAVLEEVVVVGYLITRLRQLGVEPGLGAGRERGAARAATTSTRASARSSATR